MPPKINLWYWRDENTVYYSSNEPNDDYAENFKSNIEGVKPDPNIKILDKYKYYGLYQKLLTRLTPSTNSFFEAKEYVTTTDNDGIPKYIGEQINSVNHSNNTTTSTTGAAKNSTATGVVSGQSQNSDTSTLSNDTTTISYPSFGSLQQSSQAQQSDTSGFQGYLDTISTTGDVVSNLNDWRKYIPPWQVFCKAPVKPTCHRSRAISGKIIIPNNFINYFIY